METSQTINLSACLNRLQQKLSEAVTLDQDYIPVRGTWNAARSNTDFDLDEHVDKFIAGEQKVLLLLGDSGAGKSLFCQQLQQRLLQQHLSDSYKRPLPLLISLPSSSDPVHQVIESALQHYGCSVEEIALLKLSQSFIFILDGYDEIRQNKNLYVTNNLKDWQAKVIITCRSQYLLTLDYHLPYFVPYEGERPQSELFNEVIVKPFNQTQIEAYLQQYVTHHPTEWQDWKKYQQAIEELPGLKQLIQTPFLLKLAVETMPQIVAFYENAGNESHRKQLTQAKLYDVFVKQWFVRQEDKLKASGQLNANETIQPKLWAYAQGLAKAMHQAQVTQISYAGDSDLLFVEDKAANAWDQFFSEEPETQLLRHASLLKKVGEHQYAFFHASLIDYFLSTAIHYKEQLDTKINEKNKPKENQNESQPQIRIEHNDTGEQQTTLKLENYYTCTTLPAHYHYFNQHLLTKERGMLQFFADRVQEDANFKQDLFKIVEGSKYDEAMRIAAANAITVLNKANVSFGMLDFTGIRIPYADLSYSNCDHTNFKGADLTGVNFTQAWLRKANLSYTQMTDVEFGQLPSIQHEHRVTAIAYNPNGKNMVTVDKNKLIVWDSVTQDKLQELHTGEDWIYSVAFSPNGEMVAAGGEGEEVIVWNLITQEVKRLAQVDAINAVAFSPTGNQVVAGGEEGKLILWNFTNNTIEVLGDYSTAIDTVALSPNGIYIAAGCRNEKIYLYHYVNQCCEILQGHERAVTALSFSKNQLWLVSGCLEGRVCLWHLTDNSKEIINFHKEPITTIAFSPDSTQFAFNGPQEDIYLYHLTTQQTQILTGHSGKINTLVYSPDGKSIVSGSNDRTIRIWEIKDNHLTLSLQNTNQTLNCLTLSPNGNLLASAHSNKTLQMLSLSTGHLQIITTEVAISAMAFAADSKSIIYAEDLKLYQRNLITSHVEIIDEHPIYSIESIAVSPNGQFVASGSCDLRLLDLASGKIEVFYRGSKGGGEPSDRIYSVHFSPNSAWLASSSRKGVIRVWNLNTALPLLLEGHTDTVRAVAFSPDGQWLASLADDKTIRLWNLVTQHSSVISFESQVGKLSFSPDSRYLLSSSKVGMLRFWDVLTTKCVGQIQDLPIFIKDIKFLSTTPYEFIIATYNGNSMFWRLSCANENTPTFTWHLLKSIHKMVFDIAKVDQTNIHGLSLISQKLLNTRKATYNPMQDYGHLNRLGIEKADFDQPEIAVDYFTKVLELNPKLVSAHYNLGCAKERLGRHEEAIKHHDKAICLNPKYERAYNNRSLIKQTLGDYISALDDIKIAVKLEPEDPLVYMNQAEIEEDLERYEEAIESYNQAIRLSPQGAIYFWKRSYSKSKLGRYEEALADCNRAIELDPRDSSPFYYRGMVYDDMERYEDAIKDYSKAIELDPKDAIYFNGRAISKNKLGRYEDAIEDRNKAIELDPKKTIYFNGRGISKDSLGRYEEAIEDYTKAIELNPKDESFFNNRGLSKDKLDRYEEAIADYDKAIELNPKDAKYFNNRGLSKDNLGRYEEAIADYDKAIELNPNDSDYFNNRGWSKNKLNRYELAIEDYNKAIELNPKNALYFDNRGWSKSNLESYEDAIEDCNRAIELNPNDADYFNNRGLYKDYLGQYKKAIEDYDQAILLNFKDAYIYSKRGLVKARLGYYQDALSDSEQALTLSNNKHDAVIQGRYAVVLACQGEMDKAKQHLAEIKSDQKCIYLEYYFNGWAELSLHNYQVAITYFDRVLMEEIERPYYLAASLMLRGKAYFALGNFEQARPDMEAALRHIPQHKEWQQWYQESFGNLNIANLSNSSNNKIASDFSTKDIQSNNVEERADSPDVKLAEIEKLGEYEFSSVRNNTTDKLKTTEPNVFTNENSQKNVPFVLPTKKSKIHTIIDNLAELSNTKKNHPAASDNINENKAQPAIKNTVEFWQKLSQTANENNINTMPKTHISDKQINHYKYETIYLAEEITYLSLNKSLNNGKNDVDVSIESKNHGGNKKLVHQEMPVMDELSVKNTHPSNLQQRLQFWREKESTGATQSRTLLRSNTKPIQPLDTELQASNK